MNLKELTSLVERFSNGICRNYKKNSHRKGMCWAVSAPLQTYLSLCGHETQIVNFDIRQGNEIHVHTCLMQEDKIIIDATASQFTTPLGERMPKVYIGEKPKWYGKTIKTK